MPLPSKDITTEPTFADPLALTDAFIGVQDGILGQDTLQAIYDLFAANSKVGINVQTGTTYTLAASDTGKAIVFTNASAITVTLPRQSNVALPVGFNCLIRSAGAGAVAFALQGSDVKVGNAGTGANATNDAGVILRATASTVNTWDIFGGI